MQEIDEIPAALLEYALGMAERAEAFDAMVCAHTACTDPAERQIVLRDVHDRAVDGDVAGRGAVEHLASVRVVAAEVLHPVRKQGEESGYAGSTALSQVALLCYIRGVCETREALWCAK